MSRGGGDADMALQSVVPDDVGRHRMPQGGDIDGGDVLSVASRVSSDVSSVVLIPSSSVNVVDLPAQRSRQRRQLSRLDDG